MRLMRDAWQELWQRNRGGGLLTLAFWYTVLTAVYQYLVTSRLGPYLPAKLKNFISHPGAVTAFPHIPTDLWVKLILVYLTFLLIVLPYAVGGLYGGIAAAMRDRPQFTGFLAFFRFGYMNFWKALGQIVLAILYAMAAAAVLIGVFSLLAALGGGTAAGAAAVIVAVVVTLWMVGTLLFWFGFTFSTGEPPTRGLGLALRWGLTHAGQLMTRIILLVGLLLAVLVVLTLISGIPVIGPILMVLSLGMVLPAFMAVYAILFYQESAQH